MPVTSDPVDIAPVHTGPARLAGLLADGHVSATELTRQTLAGIAATQPTVNAFRVVRAEAALREAAEADRRLAAGERAPLLGVPVAIKDDLDLAGEPTAFGCPGSFPAKLADAPAVRQLKAAGAIIVGKTNAPELGQWPFTEGPAFGATRNPWRLDRTPGGSSGGSAAAVAAGLVPVAVGSDGAGSIRIPAAWTHLVGIKPGRDTHGGALGPLARTTADAALLLDVLTGRHGEFAQAAGREPGRLRIALSLRPPFTGYRPTLDPRVRSAIENLASALADLGHEVVEANPRYGVVGLSFVSQSAGGLHEWAGAVPDAKLLDPRTHYNIVTGRRTHRWVRPLGRPSARLAARQVGRIFDRVDVVLTPTTAALPPEVGAWQHFGPRALNRAMITACPFAWPWNALGWPALNVPAGLTAEGIPVGGQLLGPLGSEAKLISLAAQLEQRQRWAEHYPPNYVATAAG